MIEGEPEGEPKGEADGWPEFGEDPEGEEPEEEPAVEVTKRDMRISEADTLLHSPAIRALLLKQQELAIAGNEVYISVTNPDTTDAITVDLAWRTQKGRFGHVIVKKATETGSKDPEEVEPEDVELVCSLGGLRKKGSKSLRISSDTPIEDILPDIEDAISKGASQGWQRRLRGGWNDKHPERDLGSLTPSRYYFTGEVQDQPLTVHTLKELHSARIVS